MRVLIFFSLFLSAISYSFAQNSNDLDKQYTPDKSSIFNNEGSSSSQGKNKNTNDVDISNAIKFNLGLLVRNTAGIFYERKIDDRITIQPGIGVCYGKDQVMGLVNADIKGNGGSGATIPFTDLLNIGTFQGANIFTSFAFRFYVGNYYYGGDVFQSGYFELNVRYSSMNLNVAPQSNAQASSTSATYYIPSYSEVNMRLFSFYMTYGYQFCTSGHIKTTHDFYIGAGIRSIKYDSFVEEQPYVGGQQVTQYVNSGNRVSALLPSMVAGYVFGFGF